VSTLVSCDERCDHRSDRLYARRGRAGARGARALAKGCVDQRASDVRRRKHRPCRHLRGSNSSGFRSSSDGPQMTRRFLVLTMLAASAAILLLLLRHDSAAPRAAQISKGVPPSPPAPPWEASPASGAVTPQPPGTTWSIRGTVRVAGRARALPRRTLRVEAAQLATSFVTVRL